MFTAYWVYSLKQEKALCALNLICLQVHILAIQVRVSASGRMVRVSMQVS